MQRPTPVTVFGILNIVFAAFGVLGVVAALAMPSLPFLRNAPEMAILFENPVYVEWLRISAIVGVGFAIALVTLGIGLLTMKPWARAGTIIYAICALVFAIAGQAVNLTYVLPTMMEQASRAGGPQAAGAIGGAIGGAFGGIMPLAYPILLLIFMTRPQTVAAFRPRAPDQPPPLPRQGW
ncbi:MAG: hypothetical protein HYX75_18035 [Acidobacteria bacterium]|nr:hypothetical protein [Acidobacteriota bacterium]